MFVADILPTGFVAVQRASVGGGDVVVVLGCGPVGLMVADVRRRSGATR